MILSQWIMWCSVDYLAIHVFFVTIFSHRFGSHSNCISLLEIQLYLLQYFNIFSQVPEAVFTVIIKFFYFQANNFYWSILIFASSFLYYLSCALKPNECTFSNYWTFCNRFLMFPFLCIDSLFCSFIKTILSFFKTIRLLNVIAKSVSGSF